MKRKIYVASSWRNPSQPHVVDALRNFGHEVYDYRNPSPESHGFGWSEVDPDWKNWTPKQFAAILQSNSVHIKRGFRFDKNALDWCDTCVCVLPSGRSAHLEAGYAAGQGKQVLFLLSSTNFEPELMYLLGHGCYTELGQIIDRLSLPFCNFCYGTAGIQETVNGPRCLSHIQ